MNTMKKIIAVAMIATMVLGCFACFTFGASAATAEEYVTDGLFAWYDANNNANGSVDPMSDYWKDLTGNGNHIDLRNAVSKNQISWADGALKINPETGVYLALPDGVKEALQGNAYTIEIVTGNLSYTATNYITLLSSANDELSVFIRCSETDPAGDEYLKLEYKNQDKNGDGNRPYMRDAWNYFNGKTLAVTSDLTAFDGTRDMSENPDQAGNVFMYSDGVQLAKGESEYNMTLDYVYFGHTDAKRIWGGEIYGLRIYNRALTAEEIAANAAADQYNYRSGNNIEPTEQYDPAKDAEMGPDVDWTQYKNNILVFDKHTDMIPLIGFYGSQNLVDYLYPYESDEPWEGARLMKTEEPDTDFDGTEFTATSFDILYSQFCTRAGMTPVTGKECQYIVMKMVVNGVFEDFNMNTIGWDAETPDTDIEFSTGSLYGGIDFDKEGEVQYLIFDVEGIFDDCEQIVKMSVDISGMEEDTEIYLQEIAFFATEEEAYTHAGEEVPTEPAKVETEPKVEDTEPKTEDTEPKTEDTQPKVETDDKTEETDAPSEGCSSVVGFGAVAVLVAAAAAVVLKKKD